MKTIKDYNSIDWNSLFYYDESSKTMLRWKSNRYAGKLMNVLCAEKDSEAGSLTTDKSRTNHNYYNVSVGPEKYKVHRIIWAMFNGEIPSNMVIDHVNGNKLDNRIENLRIVTTSVNSRNSSKSKNNSSGVNGVSWRVQGGTTYATSQWWESGKRCGKKFSVKKHGLLPAFAMACKYREDKIAELNVLGYGYTENHGK